VSCLSNLQFLRGGEGRDHTLGTYNEPHEAENSLGRLTYGTQHGPHLILSGNKHTQHPTHRDTPGVAVSFLLTIADKARALMVCTLADSNKYGGFENKKKLKKKLELNYWKLNLGHYLTWCFETRLFTY